MTIPEYWMRERKTNRVHNELLLRNAPVDVGRFINGCMQVAKLIEVVGPDTVVFPARSAIPIRWVIEAHALYNSTHLPKCVDLHIGNRTKVDTGKQILQFSPEEMEIVMSEVLSDESGKVLLVDEVLTGSRVALIYKSLLNVIGERAVGIIGVEEDRIDRAKQRKYAYEQLLMGSEAMRVFCPLVFTDCDHLLDTLLVDSDGPVDSWITPMMHRNTESERFIQYLYHAHQNPDGIFSGIKEYKNAGMNSLRDIYDANIQDVSASTAYVIKDEKVKTRDRVITWLREFAEWSVVNTHEYGYSQNCLG